MSDNKHYVQGFTPTFRSHYRVTIWKFSVLSKNTRPEDGRYRSLYIVYIGRHILSLKTAIVVSINKYIKITNNTKQRKQQWNNELTQYFHHSYRRTTVTLSTRRKALKSLAERRHQLHQNRNTGHTPRTVQGTLRGRGAATLTKVQVQDQDQDQSRALSISPGEGAGIKAAVTTASSLPPWSRRHEDFCEYCLYYV